MSRSYRHIQDHSYVGRVQTFLQVQDVGYFKHGHYASWHSSLICYDKETYIDNNVWFGVSQGRRNKANDALLNGNKRAYIQAVSRPYMNERARRHLSDHSVYDVKAWRQDWRKQQSKVSLDEWEAIAYPKIRSRQLREY